MQITGTLTVASKRGPFRLAPSSTNQTEIDILNNKGLKAMTIKKQDFALGTGDTEFDLDDT